MLTQLEQTSEENILPLNNSYMTWEGEASTKRVINCSI